MSEEKRVVQAFPRPKWIDPVSCDGKPCGGNAGCDSAPSRGGNCQSQACDGSTACDLTALLEHASKVHGGKVGVRVADYSSLASIQASLAELNQILEANHEDLRVTLENFELVFSQIAPIVAVDGVLAVVGRTPTEPELLQELGILPIASQSSEHKPPILDRMGEQ